MVSPEIQALDALRAEHATCEKATNEVVVQLKELVGRMRDPEQQELRSQFIETLFKLHEVLLAERCAHLNAQNAGSTLALTNAALAVSQIQESFRASHQSRGGGEDAD